VSPIITSPLSKSVALNVWTQTLPRLQGISGGVSSSFTLPLAAILPLLPRRLQPPIPLGLNLPVPDKRDYRNVAFWRVETMWF
jgi:hypothetical protein